MCGTQFEGLHRAVGVAARLDTQGRQWPRALATAEAEFVDREQPAVRLVIVGQAPGEIELRPAVQRQVLEGHGRRQLVEPSPGYGEVQIDVAAAGTQPARGIAIEGGQPCQLQCLRMHRHVPRRVAIASTRGLRARGVQRRAEFGRQYGIELEGRALRVSLHVHARHLDSGALRIAAAQDIDTDVLTDQGQFVDGSGSVREQVLERDALEKPLAVGLLAQLDRAVLDANRVHHELLFEQELWQGHDDAHLARCNQPRAGRGTRKLRVVKGQLGAAQTPAGIHPGEPDLHADRLARPGFQFVLVLRQARQE